MTYLESVTEAYERGYKVGVAHGRAENIEAIEAQRQERERVVALMTFLRWWDEEPEDMTDERIVEMVKRLRPDHHPVLNQEKAARMRLSRSQT